VRAGHNLDAAQESNQQPPGSPGPGSTACMLPNVPLEDGELHDKKSPNSSQYLSTTGRGSDDAQRKPLLT
jgi:hypothetical protein